MENTLGILLAFDFGTKRIGIAVGQTVTQTARPLATLKAKNGIPNWDELDKIIKSWSPQALIVGFPVNMDGSEQLITHYAKQFAATLRERYQIPVHGIDERLTTREAREQMFTKGGYKAIQNGQIDSVAAQLILETWFMHKENNSNE